jgi:hypothetical protein
VVGLVTPLCSNVQATQGYYYAWTYYKTSTSGASGSLTITTPSPTYNSGDSNFVAAMFPNNDFLAIGYFKGGSPFGSSGSAVDFYCDQRVNGIYNGWILGTATVGSVHSFSLCYQTGSLNTWMAYIDGAPQKLQQFSYRVALPLAEAEMHNTLDTWHNGLVASLQYELAAGRLLYWYNWDGYGSTGHNLPLQISIKSNTQWQFYT